MESSRKITIYKFEVVCCLNDIVKSLPAPLHPACNMSHPFVPHVSTVYVVPPTDTQQPSQLLH